MTRVSVSKLKANLSRYLREVQRGGEVEVLDRGVPVARLTGLSSLRSTPDAGARQRLIKAGIVRAGKGDARAILARDPIPVHASVLAALEEERSDRV
jgi:prevent-host-death family protein